MAQLGWVAINPFDPNVDPDVLDVLGFAAVERVTQMAEMAEQQQNQMIVTKHQSRLTRPGWSVVQ